ncbi:MAG: hypothetical protein ACYCT7_04075 [bacterium]
MCHSCSDRKVPKIETRAVSVHEAISRERSVHPVSLTIRILKTISKSRFEYSIYFLSIVLKY